ncbi:diguanylate cyclase domain-containing protein [Vibrio sp. NTOU-M3]|uniref:diguanylate cyclase domain-containing protein n=1 Tax=Vibrio sp. NTOU-M3 TaxID=3234954 RepID=UPI00349F96E8
MNRPWTSSLSHKLLKAVTVLACMYLAIILMIMVPSGFVQADKNHKELERKLALSLSSSAAIAVYVQNEQIAAEVMEALLMHEEIDAVRIEGESEVLFFAGFPVDEEPNFWSHANQYHLYSPIDGEVIGYLKIHNDHRVLRQKALTGVFERLIAVVVMFLITLIGLVIVFNKIVGRPLTKLSKSVYETTPEQAEMIPIDRDNENTELGVVVHSINTFIQSSRQAIERERELRTQIERWEQHYRNLAEQDTLTGLKNRLGCEKFLEHAYSSEQSIALFLIDLDGFKAVNDQFGHAAGDAVLADIAKRFSCIIDGVSVPGVIGRMGGDEFVVYLILSKVERPLLESVATELVKAANLPCRYQEHKIKVGCSLGITIHERGLMELEKLIHQADLAMYSVKQANKNNFRFFSERMSNKGSECSP